MVRKKIRKKELLLATAWTIMVIIFLSFYIWNQIESVRLGYEIGKLENNLQSLKKEVAKLKTEKSALLALDRVEKIAKEKLDLKKPEKEQVVYENFQPDP
ncbi:MAG: cell division protein FtsL [Candidatus Aminicenantes bacterium]